MNIATDKYLRTNTIKILHESFFTFEIENMSCKLSIFFFIVFFKQLLTLYTLQTVNGVNRLTHGNNNSSYAVNKPGTFTYRLLTFTNRFLSVTLLYHQT